MKEDKNIMLTRAVACLMVVLAHVGEQRYYDAPIYSDIFRLSALAIIISRASVPIFYMISGFLLFSKNKHEVFSLHIVKDRFLSIFIPLIFFTGIYYTYTVFMGYGINPFKNAYFSESISHLWYLGYILPVYTFSPFIDIPKLKNNKQLLALLGIIIFFFFVTESIMSKPYTFQVSYSFNQALLYMFTGYILKQFSFTKKWHTLVFALVFIYLSYISYLLLLYANDYTFNESFESLLKIVQYFLGAQGHILLSYKTLAVFLQSVALFLFFQSLNMSCFSDSFYNKISYIARRSLKIYGWHKIFIIFIIELALPWNELIIFFFSFVIAIWGSIAFIHLENIIKDFIAYRKI